MARINTRTDGATAWFEGLPPVTKLYMCTILAFTLATTLGLVNPYYLALLWPQVLKKFEVCYWKGMSHMYRLLILLAAIDRLPPLHRYGV